jgi:hypothetical protein
MPEISIWRPLIEFNLNDQLGTKPAAVSHVGLRRKIFALGNLEAWEASTVVECARK